MGDDKGKIRAKSKPFAKPFYVLGRISAGIAGPFNTIMNEFLNQTLCSLAPISISSLTLRDGGEA